PQGQPDQGRPKPPAVGQPPAPNEGDPRTRELARWFETRMGSLGQSPEFQRAMRELTQARANPNNPEWARLQRFLERTAGAAGRDLRGVDRARWPSGAPRSMGSDVHVPSVRTPDFGTPGVPGGSGAGLAAAAKPLAFLAVAGILLLAVALFLREVKRRRGAGLTGGCR